MSRPKMLLELIIIIGTIAVISAKNPVHSILFLILVFLNTAMVLISLGIDFLGIFLIIVYVGAIAILFLFVVMMLNVKLTELNDNIYKYLPIGFFFGVLFLFVFSLFASSGYDLLSDKIDSSINWTNELKIKGNNLVQLGILLYTIYLPYLMVAAIILLVAMLGVIILTFTKSKENLYQTVYQQNSSFLNNNLFS
jgi:NADH-quinone oxidoreductase subunit J